MFNVLFFLFALLMAFSPPLFCEQGRAVDSPAGVFSETQPLARPFSLTVTRDGRVTPEPGPVFTEGTEEPGTTLPYLASDPKPIVYPRWALRQGWEGALVVAVEILETGEVGRWQVMRSSGHSLLDKAALKAIREWRFEPARKEGKPLVTCIQIPVNFRLQE